MPPLPGDLRVVPITDERGDLARAAVELIRESVGDVQPTADLLSELEERRRRLPSGGDYHLIALLDAEDRPAAAAAGVFLEAVNAGFVTYLAVRSGQRERRLGSVLRGHLVAAFREEALRVHGREPAWTVGEVRRDSPWLRSLIRGRAAIPFAISYFHPWMPRAAEGRYVLYREPVGDRRVELPSAEVLRLLHAIWRRAYRIAFPLQSATFRDMVAQLEARETIGAAEGFARPAR